MPRDIAMFLEEGALTVVAWHHLILLLWKVPLQGNGRYKIASTFCVTGAELEGQSCATLGTAPGTGAPQAVT